MVYSVWRRAGRIHFKATGIVRILKRMPKTLDIEHTDTKTKKTMSMRKLIRIDTKSGVPTFNLGYVGVRYGGSGMEIRADDDDWVMKG